MGTTLYLFNLYTPCFPTYTKMATISSRSALGDITKLQNIPKMVALADIGAKVVTRQTTSKKLHLDAALVDNGDASSDRSFPIGVADIDEKDLENPRLHGGCNQADGDQDPPDVEVQLVRAALYPLPASVFQGWRRGRAAAQLGQVRHRARPRRVRPCAGARLQVGRLCPLPVSHAAGAQGEGGDCLEQDAEVLQRLLQGGPDAHSISPGADHICFIPQEQQDGSHKEQVQRGEVHEGGRLA